MVIIMKIAGIIAEYNPFHNGHLYQIEQTRKITNADYIIVVLSGDFVQRGVPAIIDKYTRTQMALENGADLVLELPVVYSTGSAEFFAMGAVSLLDKLGCVDFLCFGSEWGQLKPLSLIASLLLEEPEAYRTHLQHYLKAGCSYPKARSLALQDALSKEEPSGNALPMDFFSTNAIPKNAPSDNVFSGNAGDSILNSPNNILGVEYIKALRKRRSPIRPFTIRRQGSSYHDLVLDNGQYTKDFKDSEGPLFFSSASAIRQQIAEIENTAAYTDMASMETHMPKSVFQLLAPQLGKTFPVNSHDFSSLLFYKLLLENEKGFSHYQDMTPALSDKIRKNLNQYENYEQFCGLLKSKDLTYSRISRCLLHILLEMTEEKLDEYIGQDFISYARILGFCKTSAPLLTAIKANASIPLISKLADARLSLDNTGLSMLEKGIQASHIYSSVVSSKFNGPFCNEYTRPVIIRL